MKKTISIILTLVLLFSVLPLTTLTAGAYEGFSQENICTWWDGKDVKFHTVDGVTYYDFYFRRVLPYSDTSYETISQNTLSIKMVDGKPGDFFVDGLAHPNFSATNTVKLNDGTITIHIENWQDAINSNFAYTYKIVAMDQNFNEITSIQSDYVWGQSLKDGYQGIGGIVKLSGITDDGDAGTGTWITAEVSDCNIPVSDLQYTWKYYDTKSSYHYPELYSPQGTVIPGSGSDTTLKGVDDNLLGKYARLVVTAEGYDGAFYSPLFYYPCYTVTVDGGTAKVSGEGSSTLKAAPGDKVLLNAANKDGYAFDGWEVVSGSVTITNPSGATNAYFMMDNSDVQIKAKWKKALNIVSCTITAPNADSHPSFTPTALEPSKYDVETVYWYNETDSKTMQETDVFENNKSYTLRVYFKAKGDYAMTTDTQYFVNGEKAVVSVQGFIGYADKTYDLKSIYTVSGTITSFLSDSDSIGVFLQKDGAGLPYMQYCSGNIAGYSFNNVIPGNYTLKITKKNHVTRTYSLSVSGNTTKNVKICPLGDVDGNGKVQANDAMKAYQHAQGKADAQLSDYAFLCADVAPVGNPNEKVQAADAMVIYQQAQGKHPLF